MLHCAQKLSPGSEYVFFADEQNVPYGEKPLMKVREYTKEALDFLVKQNVDVIIMACNTATSSFPVALRGRYSIPIVGMEPAVKKAIDLYGNEDRRILVTATELTIHGDKMKKLIAQVDVNRKVDLIALPGLVRFAEKGIFSGTVVNTYLRMALKHVEKGQYGTIVLGCTHFNYFKEALAEVFSGRIRFVDGNEGTVRQALRSMEQPLGDVGKLHDVDYYFSGKKPNQDQMQFLSECLNQLNQAYKI